MGRLLEVGLKDPLKNESLSVFLDWARAIAALAVCLAHVRNLLFPDFSAGAHLGLFDKLFYFLTLFGTQAVVVFFVISGLLIGGPALQRIALGTFDVRSYAVARFSRLAVVLYPALILVLILQISDLTRTCSEVDGLGRFIRNALFLQDIVSAPLCNDHPLWSLSNEAFYYATAPVLLGVAIRLRKSLVWLGMAFAAFLVAVLIDMACSSFIAEGVGIGYLVWLAGILPFLVRLNISPLWGFGAFVVALVLSRAGLFGFPGVASAALASTFCLTLMSRFPSAAPVPMIAKTGKTLASFSYTLYLIHMPLAQAAIKLLHGKMEPGHSASYAAYFAVIGFILVTCWIVGTYLESKTGALRAWLMERLKMPAPGWIRRPKRAF